MVPKKRLRKKPFNNLIPMLHGQNVPLHYCGLSRDARPRILSAAEPLLSVLPQ